MRDALDIMVVIMNMHSVALI